LEHPEVEISCSRKNENLGPVGVYVMGDVVHAAPEDIYSEQAKNFKRIWSPYYKDVITKDNISQKKGKYAEVILTNVEVIGFWVKGDAVKYKSLIMNENYYMSQLKKLKDKFSTVTNDWQIKYFVEDLDGLIKYQNFYSSRISNYDKDKMVRDGFLSKQEFSDFINTMRKLVEISQQKRKFQVPNLLSDLEKIAQSKNLPITYLPQINFN
jgi:hypothetical protein